jgi:predicted permease
MTYLRILAHRLRSLFAWRRTERELDAELRAHLELLQQENIRKGLSREEAAQAARREFGGLEQTKEIYRDQRGLPFVSNFLRDARHSMRILRRSPGFTVVAVLTVALGVGTSSAMFSVVRGVLLKPLPYPEPGRLVMIYLHGRGLDRGIMGNADFLALHERQQAFEHVAAFSPSMMGITLTGLGAPQMIPGMSVTPDFFSVLGVQPVLGRGFLPDEGRPGGPLSVVVSHHFWEEFLHRDPDIASRRLMLEGKSYAVVGVMSPSFQFGPPRDLWLVLQLQPPQARPPFWLVPIGRLKQGVSQAAAVTDATRIARQVQQQFPRSEDTDAIIVPMKEAWVGDTREPLLILFAAVGFVLLICVANVANLQLSRSSARMKEMAIRTALGAGRGRLMIQLLTESVILAIVGSVLGLGIAYYGLRVLSAFGPDVLPRMQEIAIDTRVFLFAGAVAVATGILFGLAPASVTSLSLGGTLKEGSRGVSSGRATRRLHNALVVVEFSLALMVLTGAGLLLRSLSELEAVNPGFNPSHIFTALISLPDQRYAKASQVTSFYEQLLEHIKNSPGIENAAIALSLPPNLLELTNPFHVEGHPDVPGQPAPAVAEIPISAGYFQTLGVPLLRGRYFSDADRAPGTHVLIINESMAQRYFPGEDPIGKRVQTGEADPKADWDTIVGVVGNVKYEGLGTKDDATMYVPYFDSGWCPWFVQSLYIVVRTRVAPERALSALQSAVWSLDNQLPLARARTMDQLLYESVSSARLRTVIFSIFAALALFLAMVGIYGVIAYAVSQRTNEIGIRVALGAGRLGILKLILKQVFTLTLAGLGIGVAGAVVLTRYLSSLLYGITPTDPLTFAVVSTTLAAVALVAAYIPARRALGVDPLVALRYE